MENALYMAMFNSSVCSFTKGKLHDMLPLVNLLDGLGNEIKDIPVSKKLVKLVRGLLSIERAT